jgi:hypothetical protein
MTRSSAAMWGGTIASTSRDTRAMAAAETRGTIRFFWKAETRCSSSSRPRRKIASLSVPPSRLLSAVAAFKPCGVSTPVFRKMAETFSDTVCQFPCGKVLVKVRPCLRRQGARFAACRLDAIFFSQGEQLVTSWRLQGLPTRTQMSPQAVPCARLPSIWMRGRPFCTTSPTAGQCRRRGQ